MKATLMAPDDEDDNFSRYEITNDDDGVYLGMMVVPTDAKEYIIMRMAAAVAIARRTKP